MVLIGTGRGEGPTERANWEGGEYRAFAAQSITRPEPPSGKRWHARAMPRNLLNPQRRECLSVRILGYFSPSPIAQSQPMTPYNRRTRDAARVRWFYRPASEIADYPPYGLSDHLLKKYRDLAAFEGHCWPEHAARSPGMLLERRAAARCCLIPADSLPQRRG